MHEKTPTKETSLAMKSANSSSSGDAAMASAPHVEVSKGTPILKSTVARPLFLNVNRRPSIVRRRSVVIRACGPLWDFLCFLVAILLVLGVTMYLHEVRHHATGVSNFAGESRHLRHNFAGSDEAWLAQPEQPRILTNQPEDPKLEKERQEEGLSIYLGDNLAAQMDIP